jgi:Flp pilus assembly CpaF family ATPase
VLTANVGLPHRSVREAIALAIQLVVHIARMGGMRRVADVAHVVGYDIAADRFMLDTPALVAVPHRGTAA